MGTSAPNSAHRLGIENMLRGHSKSILKACSDLDREVPLEVFVIEIFMWAGSERYFLFHYRDVWYRD